VTRILVVDDDASLQLTLRAILEEEGYSVGIAGDGLEALDHLQDALPALVLLDIDMPRMDGIALAEEMERRGLRSSVPIVVLTADGRAQEKAARVGAESYLSKPFSLDDVLQTVARYAAPQE
jgi:chemosensory pili system protein ChpA (sensor histidine kinase/response regulator)